MWAMRLVTGQGLLAMCWNKYGYEISKVVGISRVLMSRWSFNSAMCHQVRFDGSFNRAFSHFLSKSILTFTWHYKNQIIASFLLESCFYREPWLLVILGNVYLNIYHKMSVVFNVYFSCCHHFLQLSYRFDWNFRAFSFVFVVEYQMFFWIIKF